MQMNNTIKSLISEVTSSANMKVKISNLIKNKNVNEIVMNLHQLNFNFLDSTVIVSYYVEDKNYPKIVLSIGELQKLLNLT